MKEFVQYQIEVIVCLTAFSLLYLILWRKETNFTLKRFLLLGMPILAFLLPLIKMEIRLQPPEESSPIQYITYLPSQLELVYAPAVAETLSGWEIAFWIFIAGASIMLLRLLVGYFQIWQLFHQSVPDESSEFRLLDGHHQSFSFFNLVMITRRQALSNELDYILTHEQAHSRQGHSYDIVLLEILKMMHWFNPLIWLITWESKQNLEYLADQEVAAVTNDLENYQYAIVHHATQSNYQLLKTQFSKSNLKNRIVMMNQPNNRSIKSGKLIALIPVFAILFMSFSLKIENLDIKKELTAALPEISLPKISLPEISQPELSQESEVITEQIVTTSIPSDTVMDESYEVFNIVEDPPTSSTGDMDSYYEKINPKIRYPETAKAKGIEGKVFVQFIVQKDGSLNDVKVVRGIDAECDKEAVRVIKEGPSWMPGKQRGQAVNVRIIIPIPFGVELPERNNSVSGGVYDESGNPIVGCNVLLKGTTTGTVSDFNGTFKFNSPPSDSWHELVFSMVGYESEISRVRGGTVVRMVLKKASGITVRSQGVDIFGSAQAPLFIVDGVEMENFNANSINPDDIESITVLKESSATITYGEKAKNGVIIMRTKDSNGALNMSIFDEKPIYKKDAFYEEIAKQIKYPAEARKQNIQGYVYITFMVDKDGKIQNIEKGETGNFRLKELVVVGYSSDETAPKQNLENYKDLVDEVMRVIKTLGEFNPAKKDGKPVDVRMTLPVSFRLQ